jgi:hypothetical protein
MVSCPPGTKYDAGKPRYDLIMPECELELAKILTTGAEKYADDNWKHVPDPERRYYSALRRHLEADRMGEAVDPDSGELHLAHAYACLHFLLWFRMEGAKNANLRSGPTY